MRQKQLAEFTEEEKDMMGSIGSMKGALQELGKHNEAALVQSSVSAQESGILQIVVSLRHELHKHASLLTPTQRRVVSSFVKTSNDHSNEEAALLQEQSPHAGYAPQSGAIFGVIGGMKESFESNLADSQREETSNQHDYESVKSAKSAEITAGQSLQETKSAELANTDERNAQSKQDLHDTKNVLAADTKFLANLKEQCANVGAEFAERTKTRQLESQAVSKALAHLSSDDAMDLASRTFGFLQVQKDSAKRAAGVNGLLKVAKLDPRISILAMKARNDAFVKVRESIQSMVDKLVQEKEDEIKHKDFCVDEINKNEAETDAKNRMKQNHQAKIEELTMLIDQLTKGIAELKAEIADTYVQVKRAGEDRNRENKEFQMTVADQRATQKLIAGALDILKGFYEKSALVQQGQKVAQPAGPPPPPSFKKYENNAQSGGVMGMMEQVMADAKAMEEEALQGEEAGQVAYETFITDSNTIIKDAQRQIVNKTEDRAKADAEKAQKTQELEQVDEEIMELAGALADLHSSCDYTIKNFDAKQEARDNEITGLKEAIAIFSGAKFGAFLQGN